MRGLLVLTQCRKKLFYGGGLSKMSAIMIDRRQKINKLQWLKRLKTVSKNRNFDQRRNDSKPHIWSLSFNFRFSSTKSQGHQKLPKKITHFIIQFRLKILTYFTNLNSLNIVKSILLHSQKPTHFIHFSANMFLVSARKNICTAPFLYAQEVYSRSTGKANVCIFLYISVKTIFFQRRTKFLSGGG